MRLTILPEFESDEWRGIRRYRSELVDCLKGAQTEPEGAIKVDVFSPPENFFRFSPLVARRVLYPLAAMRISGGPERIFHVLDQSYANLLHFLPRGKTVVTCHDLEFWRKRTFKNQAMRSLILSGLKRAGHVACVSQAVYDELLELWPEGKDRASVVANGISPRFSPVSPEERLEIRKNLGLKNEPVLLHVGNVSFERKNFGFLLGLMNALQKSMPQIRLVQIGGTFTAEQEAEINRRELQTRVKQITDVSDDELVRWYRAADAVLIPSTYEGFGFPWLEAAACGTPVVSSDIAVFREIARGEYPLFPLTISKWEEEILKLAGPNANLERRRALGLEISAGYRFEKTAEQFKSIYQMLLGRNL